MQALTQPALCVAAVVLLACKSSGEDGRGEPAPSPPAVESAPPAEPAAPPVAATSARGSHPNKWPDAERGALDASDLENLADDGARSAAVKLTEVVMENDAPGFSALLASRLKVLSEEASADDARARVAREGPQGFVGIEPNCADGHTCDWHLWRLDERADGFDVYFGSGYGETRVVRFGREQDAWKVVAIIDVDFGAP